MDRIRDWFSVEGVGIALGLIVLFAIGVLVVWIILNPHTVYDRIDECVAMEVYTRAECVVIESAR